ncbi:hypothetical protein HKD37_04G010801 [Glycine soja]
MKKQKVAAIGVSLSEAYALSEQHSLSETSACLASQGNLEKNLPCMHAPSTPSTRPASRLSLLALSVPGSLSQKSLTRA